MEELEGVVEREVEIADRNERIEVTKENVLELLDRGIIKIERRYKILNTEQGDVVTQYLSFKYVGENDGGVK